MSAAHPRPRGAERPAIAFALRMLPQEVVRGRDVLEVGSWAIEGTVRSDTEALGPRRYVGVDIRRGVGVDIVCPAERLLEQFGAARFDIVVATEVVEHIRDWRTAFRNMMEVLRPNGLIVLTTRSRGYPYHGSPHDYWRYEPGDLTKIFDGWEIQALERDTRPGVFIRARKTTARPPDLDRIALFSVPRGRRSVKVTTPQILFHRLRSPRRAAAWLIPERAKPPLRRLAGRWLGYSTEFKPTDFG